MDAAGARYPVRIDPYVQQGPKLEEASIVVSGGRGIGAAENYAPLVEELAKLLKGAWGASRARNSDLGTALPNKLRMALERFPTLGR